MLTHRLQAHVLRAHVAVGVVGYLGLVVGPAPVGALADRTRLRFAIGSLMLAAATIAAAIAAGGSIATRARTD